MEVEESLSTALNTDYIFFMVVPIVTNKTNFVNELIKYTPALDYNTKLVTVDKSAEGNKISFNQLKEKFETCENTFFIVFDYNLLLHYAGDLLGTSSSNTFIILLDIRELNIFKDYDQILNLRRFIFLYPKNMDMPINFITNTRKTYIYGNQLKLYFDKVLETSQKDNNDYSNAGKYLNVYLDDKVKSLAGLNLDKALQRAPKFKTILLDILIKNKKRHLIRMVDGPYGIDSFLTVFNKIKDIPRLILIKNSDDYNSKIKKLRSFNESNAPGILLTDYHFTGNMAPSNIDAYHITDGGDKDDNDTIFNLCKARNYTGNYPRTFHIYDHITVSTGKDITVDEDKKNEFMRNYEYTIKSYQNAREDANKMYLKGNEFYIGIKN